MDRNNILHFKYWIGILIGLIVLVIAAAWGADPKIAEKVNFAVGVTSVILAVLAIYVTINFNSFFSNNISTFLNLNTRVENAAAKLVHATNDLGLKLELIPTGFRDLKDTILARTFTSQQQASSTEKEPLTSKTGVTDWKIEDLTRFYVSLRYLAMVVVYLGVVAFRKSKGLSSDHFTRMNFPGLDTSYFMAVMSVLQAVNLCIIDYDSGQQLYTIKSIHPLLESNIDSMILGIIDRIKSGKATPTHIVESGKIAVDSLFSETSSPALAAPKTSVPPTSQAPPMT
jgi:hypothetical protein